MYLILYVSMIILYLWIGFDTAVISLHNP